MRIAVSLVALFSVMGIARADDLESAQSIIRSQEHAIVNDDSASAYSFAGPPITSMYRNAAVFMYMVQKGYAPIYRHKSFELGEANLRRTRYPRKFTSSMPTESPGRRFTYWSGRRMAVGRLLAACCRKLSAFDREVTQVSGLRGWETVRRCEY
jgi:hypothetical protein